MAKQRINKEDMVVVIAGKDRDPKTPRRVLQVLPRRNLVLVEGANHGSLMQPHPGLWPNGLIDYIHRAMWKRWQR